MAELGRRWQRLRAKPINGGLNLKKNSALIEDGESPDVLNIDFDKESVSASGGSIKFNNQTAPRPGLKVGIPIPRGGIDILPGKTAPSVGYAYIPYRESQDVGGELAVDTYSGAAAPHDRVWHRQRGRSFEVQASFKFDGSERLFAAPTLGQKTTTVDPVWDMTFGADQALDEFTAIIQKGGDRLTPMSWALGVVNTGELFDIDVGGGLNIFGVSTATYATRPSNYALCFMWLDLPAVGARRPVQMRYRLTAGSVLSDEGAGVADTNGEYSTHAYRSFIAPLFVEPGRTYHVNLQLALDTGTSGTTWNSGTGELSGVSWNDDGEIAVRAQVDFGATQTFTWGGSTLFRYKGPSDSLEYFSKYGIRYHGRDAMFVGLGYRYAPWAAAGFVPFGIDSCPVENGGFQITDQSVHGPVNTAYAELLNPELELNAGGNSESHTYGLRLAHDTDAVTGDPTGTLFEVNFPRMVRETTWAGVEWGNETSKWPQVAAHGRLPWSPYDVHWAGLGGAGTFACNEEALRSYRLIFSADNGGGMGFTQEGAAGYMLSIGTYVDSAPYASAVYAQHIVVEGGSAFATGSHADFGAGAPYSKNGTFYATIRAFRWHQRPVTVSDIVIAGGGSTAWDSLRDFQLSHEFSAEPLAVHEDEGEVGLGDLASRALGCWPCTDGGGRLIRDVVAGNHAFMEPMGTTVFDGGTKSGKSLFLSGEGEALYLDLGDSSPLAGQVREAMRNPDMGLAIQMTVRLPEASYGLARRVSGPDGSVNVFETRFAPTLAAWDIKEPRRVYDPVGDTSRIDHIAGNYWRPPPILEFGHNLQVTNAIGVQPTLYPLGFSLRTPSSRDQRWLKASAFTELAGWNGGGSQWDTQARWVGQTVTFQFGIIPTGTEDQYTIYIAATPKELLNPEDGDASGAEFAYFESQTIGRRELERSIITIGGAWNPTLEEYYDSGVGWLRPGRSPLEHTARMIVEDFHVLVTSASGSLPAASGDSIADGTGKIVGASAQPQRELKLEDVVRPIGNVWATSQSFTLEPPKGGAFPTTNPKDDLLALLGTYLVIGDATIDIPNENTIWSRVKPLHLVTEATATQLTLARSYSGQTVQGLPAWSTRHAAYCAFSETLESEVLLVGSGRGYQMEESTEEDALVTAGFFSNVSPLGPPIRYRIYSALAAGRSRDFQPQWVRGLKRCYRNAIRGIHGHLDRVYVGAQGSLFRADDRWREDGPTTDVAKGMYFGSGDRVVFGLGAAVDLTNDFAWNGATLEGGFIDAWVDVDSIDGIQTIAWVGGLESNAALSAGAGHHMQWWLRLNRGRPELVVGSTDTVSAAAIEGNMFVATAAVPVPIKEKTHIRVILQASAEDGDFSVPLMYVGGAPVNVTVNASGDAAGGTTWVDSTTVVDRDSTTRLVLGAARRVVKETYEQATYASAQEIAGTPMQPGLTVGWGHELRGILHGFAMYRRPVDGVSQLDTELPFNPRAVDYSSASSTFKVKVLVSDMDSYGVGHKLYEAVSDGLGVVYSHPLISLSHEMGHEDAPWSFAEYDNEVFCANGGRVGVIENDTFRFAGVLPPQGVPKAVVKRLPLWENNYFDTAGDPDNDPVFTHNASATNVALTSPTVTTRAYHFRNPGTQYLSQPSSSSMAWTIDTFLAFKCLFSLDSVSGRIPIYGRRDSTTSGNFIEVRDGYVYAGWWDTSLRKEVWVRTSKVVIRPGYNYWLYYRKWYPRGGLNGGGNAVYTPSGSNWANSIHQGASGTAAVLDACYDALIVREFPRDRPGNTYDGWTGFDAKSFVLSPVGGANYDYTTNDSTSRNCVSFTLADSDLPDVPYTLTTEIGPTGVVLWRFNLDEATMIALANGTVVMDTAGQASRLLLDHVGMFLQIEDPTASQWNKQIYRIVSFSSATRLRVVSETDAFPSFAALGAGSRATIFSGVSLVKSEDYDSALNPDTGDYDVEIAGSSLSANPLNGVSPFYGRIWGATWGVFAATTLDGGSNSVGRPNIFESASFKFSNNHISHGCELGTETFGLQGTNMPLNGTLPCDGTPAGQVQAASGNTFGAFHTTGYNGVTHPGATAGSNNVPVTTVPNADKAVAVSSGGSGDPCEWVSVRPVETGERLIRVTCYDAANDIESGPTDEVSINIQEEDANPSAAVDLILRDLPTHDNDRSVSLRVYMSEAAGSDLFLASELDGSGAYAAVIRMDDVATALSIPLPLTERSEVLGEPPRAKYVTASQGRMCYANLLDQPDGVAFSLEYNPEVVPPVNIFPVNTGDEEITGIADLSGLVVFKRSSLSVHRFDENGYAYQEKVSRGDGCVAHATIATVGDRMLFLSDRGPMVLLDNWEPFHLSRRIEEFFKSDVDPDELRWAQAGINRQRGQYVFTTKSADVSTMRERYSIEFTHPVFGEDTLRAELLSGSRFSYYSGPDTTAIGQVQARGGGAYRVVGGDRHGFILWMDRSDTRRHLVGSDTAVWGGATIADASAVASGTFDTELEGPMGVVLRSGVTGEEESYILFAPSSTSVFLEELGLLSATQMAATDAAAYVGGQLHRWSTKFFDADTPELDKLLYYLDVTRTVTSGLMEVDCFRNHLTTASGTVRIDLTLAHSSEDIGSVLQQARSFRFLFRTGVDDVDINFELLDVTVRFIDTDVR